MKFNEKLRTARMALGMTQSSLASLTGLKKRTIAYYEMGVKCPEKYNTYKKLAGALGLDAAVLVNDTVGLPLEKTAEPENPGAARLLDCMGDVFAAA